MRKTYIQLTQRQFNNIMSMYRKPNQTTHQAIIEIVRQLNKGGALIPDLATLAGW